MGINRYMCGMDADCLTLSPFKNMPADVAAKAQAVVDEIKSGKLNVFKGPIIDNLGNEINSGATLDDGGLWGMDYYVQGVIGKIPG